MSLTFSDSNQVHRPPHVQVLFLQIFFDIVNPLLLLPSSTSVTFYMAVYGS